MGPYSLKRPAFLIVTGACLAFAAAPAQARKEIVLYSFCQASGCPDGQTPQSSLAQDAHGNLFGTTDFGGNPSNAGTIYELQKVHQGWVFHSLYSFCPKRRCSDGNEPLGGLVVDTSGNLYGTTYIGGYANNGVVFELKRNGKYNVLYRFCVQSQCPDGSGPVGGLTYQGQQTGALYDGVSPLYGTAQYGGAINWGVVYTITPGEAESVLYSFGADNNTNDGQEPEAPLIMDSAGNLYGTTFVGGSTGDGTVFGISPSGSETLLFAFCSQEPHDCGSRPESGQLLIRADGSLAGVTPFGGHRNTGVIYSLAAGTYTTLANFCGRRGCKAGSEPTSGLIEDSSGNLYGVAGGVFEFTASKLKTIYTFCAQPNCADGEGPSSKLIMNSRGALFGTTIEGGAFGGGTIFELR